MSVVRGLAPWLLYAVLGACGSNPPAPPSAGPGPTAPASTIATGNVATGGAPAALDLRGPAKPSAPITLTLVAHPLASTGTADRFELVLTATPARDVDRVELAIDGQPSVVAAATAGAPSEARATVELAHGEGRDVIATAAVFVDGKRMGAATSVRIGAPAPAAPAGTIIHLPDGTPVQEVRP